MEESNSTDKKLTNQEYFNQLIKTFPTINKDFWEDGETHYNMERFADFTIYQIKNSNWDKLKECFYFQEQRIKYLNPALENALNVSYCESLLLSGLGIDMNEITGHMGPLLRQFYKDYELYYNNLVRLSQQKNQ